MVFKNSCTEISNVKTVDDVIKLIDAFFKDDLKPEDAIKFIIDVLSQWRSYYNWIGIYILEADGTHLRLYDYYIGQPTSHVRIPISRGICGAAVRERQTIIVPDVSKDPRYLACNLETRSEIVVPIWKEGRIIGEIDIDSYSLNAFNDDDRKLLESVAQRLAKILPLVKQQEENN